MSREAIERLLIAVAPILPIPVGVLFPLMPRWHMPPIADGDEQP